MDLRNGRNEDTSVGRGSPAEEAARRRRELEKQEAELAERLRARRACDEELERLNREIDALKRRREEIFKKREGGDE